MPQATTHRTCLIGAKLMDSDIDHELVLAEALLLFDSGNISIARESAGEAAYLANLDGDRLGEASARMFGALFDLFLGSFKRAERGLEAVLRLFASVPSRPDTHLPIARAALGALYSLRGDVARAEQWFAAGLDAAAAVGDDYREAIVRALRSDLFVGGDHRRAEDDARQALDVFERVGDDWFDVWARRGLARATVEAGTVGMGERLLHDLCCSVSNPLERGRTELALGRVLLRTAGAHEAVAVLRRAAERFERCQASHLHAQALALLRDVSPGGSGPEGARLAALAAGQDDPAWTLLLWPRHQLDITLLGSKPGIALDGTSLELRPRALVLLAAVVTGEASSRSELQELLWPDAFDSQISDEVTRGRLRDALHELRSGLGKAACRLSRGDDPVDFDLRGAYVDYVAGQALVEQAKAVGPHAAVDRQARISAALAVLDQPFMGSLAGNWDWVATMELRRQALVARLKEL